MAFICLFLNSSLHFYSRCFLLLFCFAWFVALILKQIHKFFGTFHNFKSGTRSSSGPSNQNKLKRIAPTLHTIIFEANHIHIHIHIWNCSSSKSHGTGATWRCSSLKVQKKLKFYCHHKFKYFYEDSRITLLELFPSRPTQTFEMLTIFSITWLLRFRLWSAQMLIGLGANSKAGGPELKVQQV